ncbi:hypothetical protein [Myxococcus stipitatus]|uniref:hypothetical protein n=1 Tax=Myxococcus stipitatus TaxID=83455 RepID=UPI0030CF6DFA
MHSVMKATVCMAVLATFQAWGSVPSGQDSRGSLASQAFFKPELSLVSGNVPLREAVSKLKPEAGKAWADFFARNGKDFEVFIDRSTGTASNILGAVPLIPGSGVGNSVTVESIGRQLDRSVPRVDGAVVADLVFRFIEANREALGVEIGELGEVRVDSISQDLWQVSIAQEHQGIPVRHGRIVATLSHGNLVLLGTESWRDVDVSPMPLVDAERATMLAHEHLGLFESPSMVWQEPTLEVAPMSVPGAKFGEEMGHQLVWTYGFQLQGEHERWKVTVDATTGEVLALEDDNHYSDRSVRGGVYPFNYDGPRPPCDPYDPYCIPQRLMVPNYPMPWANVGSGVYTDGMGVYDYTSGTRTATLQGRYIRIVDHCGAMSVSSATGDINLKGVDGDHNCTPGISGVLGNTASSRTAFYELNRIAELARGWLPNNAWLQTALTVNVNINQYSCNAYWSGSSVNFYRGQGGCLNKGEVAAVLNHEWAHGLDDNDSGGGMSSGTCQRE